jgi:hypothetical protein
MVGLPLWGFGGDADLRGQCRRSSRRDYWIDRCGVAQRKCEAGEKNGRLQEAPNELLLSKRSTGLA